MYQQNSPNRGINANFNVQGPQAQFSPPNANISFQGNQGQFSYGQQSPPPQQNQFGAQQNFNAPQQQYPPQPQQPFSPQKPSQFSAQTQPPSFNISANNQFQGSANISGPSLSLNTQGGQGNAQVHFDNSQQQPFGQRHEANFNGQQQFSAQNNFSSNNNQFGGPGNMSFQGPEPNISLGGGQFNANLGKPNLTGPGPESAFDMNQEMPTDPSQIKTFITKRPYLQVIEGQDVVYSLLDKKPATFGISHGRLLILKGIDLLAYARELPPTTLLPFRQFTAIPAPKAGVPISNIAKVEVVDDKLVVRHNDEKKTVWEFQCPSKGCATQWNQHIGKAMDLFREYQTSGYTSTSEFLRSRKGGSFNTRFDFPRFDAPKNDFNFKANEDVRHPPPPPPNNFGGSFNISSNLGSSTFNVPEVKAPEAHLQFGINNQYGQQSPITGSPVKNQYESPIHGNNPNLNINANYQGAVNYQGNVSTQGSSGRSYTISSNSSLGRYPMGVPVGMQMQNMSPTRSNLRGNNF